MQDLSSTQYFKVEKAPELKIGDVLEIVYKAMAEKGYNPINQIVGYIMSGDRSDIYYKLYECPQSDHESGT